MPEGKYFFIKSQLNELVLDVDGGSREPGTRVITWFQKPDENENQLWFEDHLTGTIRSKLTGHCLDTDDDGALVVCEYDTDKENQQWITSGDRVQRRGDPNIVLDISEADTTEGATVIAFDAHDGDNQRWVFEYTPACLFYIRSAMHGKVLDIKNGDTTPGVKAVIMTRTGDLVDNQLWYEDRHGVICSKLTNYVLDSGEDDKIRLQPFQAGSTTQMWTIQDTRIVNRVQPSMVLDIKGNKEKDGAKLVSYPWQDQDNQKWHFEYL